MEFLHGTGNTGKENIMILLRDTACPRDMEIYFSKKCPIPGKEERKDVKKCQGVPLEMGQSLYSGKNVNRRK